MTICLAGSEQTLVVSATALVNNSRDRRIVGQQQEVNTWVGQQITPERDINVDDTVKAMG